MEKEFRRKMNQEYLQKMEEKIFHTKRSQCKCAPEKFIAYTNKKQQLQNDMLQQLSAHKMFQHQQQMNNDNNNNNKCGSNGKKVCVEVVANGKLSHKRSNKEPDPIIVDIMRKDSTKSFYSLSPMSSCKTVKLKANDNEQLFNANYTTPVTKSKSNFANFGLSLLESIRNKVFGLPKIDTNYDLDDEWRYDSSATNVNHSLKFPKETRHAMSSLTFSPHNSNHRQPQQQQQQQPQHQHLCDACARELKNIEMSDAQTSPIVSETDIQPAPPSPPPTLIPCPLNLLCDRGIHLGRCKPASQDEGGEHQQRRQRNGMRRCTCNRNRRFKGNGRKYPGRAQPANNNNNMINHQHPPAQKQPDNNNVDVDVRASMETVLQLIETLDHFHMEFQHNDVKNMAAACPHSKMNGLNGHSNGDMNGCGDIITQNQQKGCWTIGLINTKYRYLTAETFGFKINANGASLKKKQIWTLEPECANNSESLIYLRSHLDKYLAVDSFGNVTCESDEKDPGCQFQISVAEDGTGRWALKNVVRGYFLGSTLDKLTCTAKVPSDSEFWHVHLAARPQMNLRSVGRKRFAHLSENLDEIHVDANIPWGEDTLFTLEFRLEENGKYAIHTCNNKYLSMGGKLVEQCNKDCLFSAEYHSGQLALRDRTGAYLSPIGSKAVLKTRSNTVTKDELFSLEDSLPQASFVAALNSRFVSVKQGVDVTANQDEISDHETFQLEFDWSTKRWYIRTMQDRYWTLETGGGIQACGDKRSSNALFDLVWQCDGSLAFRANNGRYVITKRSGHLYATADSIDENCKYFFYLINRPILVLKCEQGFVGYKTASNPKLECNKAIYECIQVERGEKGVVYFKGQNGKYWHADSEGVTSDSDTKEGFYLELREPTRLCIKSLNGNYLTASKNGLFRLGDTSIENATQWEY